MPIKVACRCGQSFAAKDELAGKTVKCPKCQAALVIPSAAPITVANSALNDLLEEEGFSAHSGVRCPKCNEPIPVSGMVCIACGHNIQTGMSVAPGLRQKSKNAGHGEATELILQRAAEELRKSPPPKDETAGGMMVSYLLTIGMFVITASVATAGFLLFRALEGSSNKGYMSGVAMGWIGAGLMSLGGIWIMVLGFMESAVCGLCCTFIPFYGFYFGIMKGHRFQLFLQVLGFVMVMGGWGLATFATQVDPSKPIGSAYNSLQPAPYQPTGNIA